MDLCNAAGRRRVFYGWRTRIVTALRHSVLDESASLHRITAFDPPCVPVQARHCTIGVHDVFDSLRIDYVRRITGNGGAAVEKCQ
ncbi:hypothetical protein [Pseudoduganella albidiflava]|uniref:Uncharacterized protein n=1 Tax=Pseudoduganella albidiflava TaxID=321983 RepID=A0ABX5RT53_9BURK|nr:hypothetical protein [Pseudoduganella albidiflava]QBI01242.1 hypothetical protein EYF70_10625 [Pseudoduganella albidiflava]